MEQAPRSPWEGLAVAVAQRPAELHGVAHGTYERPRLDLWQSSERGAATAG